jgi:WD40 repeat protein
MKPYSNEIEMALHSRVKKAVFFNACLLLISLGLCLWPKQIRGEDFVYPYPSGRTTVVEVLPDTIPEGDQDIASIAISPNGQILAAGGLDGTLRLWDLNTCKLIKVLRLVDNGNPDDGPYYVTAVAFSPDGRLLAGGSRDWLIRLWAPASMPKTQESFKLFGHKGHVHALAFDSKGKFLVSAGHDGVIKFWSIGDRVDEIATLSAGPEYIFSVALSPDGRFLISGGNEWAVRIWDVTEKKLLRRIETPGRVRSVAYSPNGDLMAAAIESDDRENILVWNAQSGERLLAHSDHTGYGALSVTFTVDGQQVISGGKDGKVVIWDIRTISRVLELKRFEKKGGSVNSLAIMPNGRDVVSGGYSLLPHLWDHSSGDVSKIFTTNGCNPFLFHERGCVWIAFRCVIDALLGARPRIFAKSHPVWISS